MSELTELQPKQAEVNFTPGQLQEKLREPELLPTHEEIKKAFANDEEWSKFFENKEAPVFELLNEEYLNALSDYFVGRIQKYGENKEEPFVILEIGAGNGRLSHFLRKKLEERIPGETKVVATDSGKWGLKNHFPVEQLEYDKAMERYNPDMVICSWMPLWEDFTKDIRKCDSVKEYVLIGDCDCCGDDWETWGRHKAVEKSEEEATLFEEDSFEQVFLRDLNSLQFCRTDFLNPNPNPSDPSFLYFGTHHSETNSFRRKK